MHHTLIISFLFSCLLLSGCAGSFSISGRVDSIATPDGNRICAYPLFEEGAERKEFSDTRALVFYISGSGETESVRKVIGAMAGFVMMDMQVILIDRRGIAPDGTVDLPTAYRFSDKAARVADTRTALHHYLEHLSSNIPVVLVGGSEGGDIAAAVAVQEPRVNFLILLGCGGGMSQADELKLLARTYPGIFGDTDERELERRYTEIKKNPESEEQWLGHSYRRWSSFLWSPPVDDLKKLSIPIFLAQGDADRSVPVESARRVQAVFADAAKNNLRYHEYAGIDHSFRETATGRNALPLVETDIVAWFENHNLIRAVEAEAYRKRVRDAHPEWF